MTWTLIESAAHLEEILAAHQHQPCVAVDTEFRRRDTFYPQVALLQLCWGDEAFLVDPLQLERLLDEEERLGIRQVLLKTADDLVVSL